MTASKFNAGVAASTLAQPCPGGPGHRGPQSPRALCVSCLVFALDCTYEAGRRDEQVAQAVAAQNQSRLLHAAAQGK